MPDAGGNVAPVKAPTPTSPPASMPPPTYVPPSAKVKAQQRVVTRTAPLSEPFVDPKASAFTPLSPVAEVPIQSSAARTNVPPAGPMPQTLFEAKDDGAVADRSFMLLPMLFQSAFLRLSFRGYFIRTWKTAWLQRV